VKEAIVGWLSTKTTAWAFGACAVALVLGLGGAAVAQDARAPASGVLRVTLGDALRQALQTENPNLQQQRNNVAAAAARVQEARGAFDWTTNVQGGWQQLYVPTPENGFLTNRTSTESTYYYSANVGRRFRNGVEVAPGITAYPGSGATPAQTSGLTQIRPALGLRIPLLRGAGTANADAAERSAEHSLEGARETRAFATQQFAQSVAATFWRCVADDQMLQETRDTDRHSAEYGATLNKMVNQGLLEPTVAQQWAAGTVGQHLGVERASDEAQRCRRDLAFAITGESGQPWPQASGELPDVAALGPAVDRIDEQALIALALAQRLDLSAANRSIQAARENVRIARDSARPQLDLHVDPDRAIVSFSKTFGNNLAKGREAEASAAQDQADLALRQLQEQVREQVSDSIVNLKRALADWNALDEAEKQMRTVVSDAEKRARYGSISWGDFLNLQNQLTQLQEQVINARLAFAINLATLRLATGTIDADRPLALATDLVILPMAGSRP
jgi:outer membrane protein TolC